MSKLFLDANNPRWKSHRDRTVADARIPNESVQARARERLNDRYGLQELKNSIMRNGFLPLDRIVVRPLSDHDDKYVVVEGNRRLAAVQLLVDDIEQEAIDDGELAEGYLESLHGSLQELECLLYSGTNPDINWMLQGIRHLSGIREWEPAQQAELVVDQVDADNSFTAVGQMFGLTNRRVGQLYRGYKGLRQMADNDEFGDKAKNDLFTLFDEAHRNPQVRRWLEWNDSTSRYENSDNLRTFYSWIVEDEEHNRRRIHDPRHVKVLNKMLAASANDLISDVENFEVSIEGAEARLNESEQPAEWRAELEHARRALSRVPAQALRTAPVETRQELNDLLNVVQGLIDMIPAGNSSSTEDGSERG